MTQYPPKIAKRVNALVSKQCCNYDKGNCILLDDGDECICPQTISYSLICKWFRNAVLPNDKDLYIKLTKQKNAKKCIICGAEYTSASNRSKYCDSCRRKVRLHKEALRKRNKRLASAFRA